MPRTSDSTCHATLSLKDAARKTWDVVVAGAGPAGAVCARLLAVRGISVLLVDKAEFPRDKVCGDVANGAALSALRAAGLADLPAALGAVRLTTMRIHAGNCQAALSLPEGVVLSRHALDLALVRAAIAAGASFLPGTEAMLAPQSDLLQSIRLHGTDESASVAARLAVAADGLAGGFLKAIETMAPIVARHAPLGIGAVTDEPSDCYAAGTISMGCTPRGYVGVVRLEDGRLDIALALDRGVIQDAGGSTAAALTVIQESGLPCPPSLARASFRGTPLLTRRRHCVARPGLVVIGDAAGYLEPFTGEGMSWAMQQAVLAAPLIQGSIVRGDLAEACRWQRTIVLLAQPAKRLQVCHMDAAEFLFWPFRGGPARPSAVARGSLDSINQPCVARRLAEHRPMSMAICGSATALPERSIAQSAAAAIAQTFLGGQRDGNTLLALFRRTHVQKRSSVLLEQANGSGPRQSFYWPAAGPDDHGPSTAQRMRRYQEESLPLAAQAAEEALQNAGVNRAEVTHVITVSCTGFFAPGIDIGLIKQLKLPPTVGRLHVGFMGCHGVLNALRAAQAIVDANASAVVLICAVELCSLHYQYGGESDKLVANALFADGRGGALAGRADAQQQHPWRVVSSGSFLVPDGEEGLVPDGEEGMTWRIGDHGFEMTLSPRVPELIGRHVRPWMESWLAAAGRRLEDIRSWAIHPGGPRILTSVAAALGLPDAATEASAEVLAACGNMSSPTVVFILQRLMRQAAQRPCVMLGFGPGLVAEAALLEE